jgi:hypothetical protein
MNSTFKIIEFGGLVIITNISFRIGVVRKATAYFLLINVGISNLGRSRFKKYLIMSRYENLHFILII